jgi:hypothetical protein
MSSASRPNKRRKRTRNFYEHVVPDDTGIAYETIGHRHSSLNSRNQQVAQDVEYIYSGYEDSQGPWVDDDGEFGLDYSAAPYQTQVQGPAVTSSEDEAPKKRVKSERSARSVSNLVAVIFLSAHSPQEMEPYCLDAGISRYLSR